MSAVVSHPSAPYELHKYSDIKKALQKSKDSAVRFIDIYRLKGYNIPVSVTALISLSAGFVSV